MADDPNISDGLGGTVPISADDAGGKYVQRVKLAYSADGAATHVTADVNGLLVNLGANNDVVASGTVSVSGTPTVSVAGTPTVNISGGTTVFSGSLSAGTALIGRVGIGNSTALADTLTLSSGTALAVGIVNTTGQQLTFAAPAEVSATPSVKTTGGYTANTSLDSTIITFSPATSTDSGSGWVTKFVLLDKDGEGLRHQVFLLNASITPPTEGSAFTLSDADAEKIVGVIDTADGSWYGYGGGSVCVVTVGPPLPYALASGTALYAVSQVVTAGTYTSSSDIIYKLHLIKD